MSNNRLTLAIATTDGVVVAGHLARCARFLVYSVGTDGRSLLTSTVERGPDECGNHRTFTDLLRGCDAVLCGGAGQGAVSALAAAGTRTVVLARPYGVQDALAGYLDGTLETSDARVCLCGPSH